MLSDPKRLRTPGGYGYLVSWKDRFRVQNHEEHAAALVERVLDDPANVEALRAGIGRPEASREELAEWLVTGLVGGGLHLLKTRVNPPVMDSPPETNLFDLLPSDASSTDEVAAVPSSFALRAVDEVGEPLEGLKTRWLLGGVSQTKSTDPGGMTRGESTDGASFASATVTADENLRDPLGDRWTKIREPSPLAPADERTFTTLSELRGGELRVQLTKGVEHTLVVYPDVTLARLLGLFFQTNKSFLLPDLQLPRLREIYEARPGASLLIVGHTDTTGEPELNDALSLERAEAVAAYLRDDVDAWLANYSEAVPQARRWGTAEDGLMLDENLRRDAVKPTHRVRHYQQTRDLHLDGIIGSATRRALVTEYMGLDGVTIPGSMTLEVHGCGEQFPVDAQGEREPEQEGDELDDLHDRRVELFFFDDALGVLPRPQAPIAAQGSPIYAEWRRRARRTLEFRGAGLATRVPRMTLDGFFNPGSAVLLPAKPWLKPMDATPYPELPEFPSFLKVLLEPLIRPFRTLLDYLEPEEDRRANLAALGLAGLLTRMSEEASTTVFVAGHASEGERGDGDALSEARATCVLEVLKGNPEAFALAHDVACAVQDDYVMVRHLSRAMGWTADPGPPKPEPTPELAAAVLRFQCNFNERFDASIAEDGSPGPQTRGAYGRVFQQLLADYVGGESALQTLRSAAGLTRAVILSAASGHPARDPQPPQSGRTVADARVEIVLVPNALTVALDAESLYGETFDFVELPLFVLEDTPVVNPREASAQERGRTELPDERTDGGDTSDYEPIEPDDPWDFLNAVPNEWNERTETEPLPLGGESDGTV